jgi:hypothetical protein
MPRTPAQRRDEVLPKQVAIDTVTSTATATEATGETAVRPDPTMQQAKRDLDAGMVDTDMRATPGLDAQRRATLVRGPGGQAPALAGGSTQQPAAAPPQPQQVLQPPRRKRRGALPDLG